MSKVDPTLMADQDGVVRMASSAAAELFGSAARDLEGLRLDELLESPAREVVEALFGAMARGSEVTTGDTPVRLAVRLRLPRGRMADADLRLSRLPGTAPMGGATLVSIEVLDEAPRRLGEGRQVAGLPGEVGAAATDDLVVVCRGDVIEQIEGRLVETLGVPASELLGWRIRSLVAAEDLLPVVEILRNVESGAEEQAEFGFHLLRAGGLAPLEVAARARRIATHGTPAVLVGLRDISESLRTARLAAERLTQLGAALEATGDAVLILGLPEARSPVILASGALQDLFGVDGSRWVGRSFWDLWQELRAAHGFPESEQRILGDLLRDPATVRVDIVPLALPQGRVIERYMGPMRAADDQIIGSICIFRDVTQRAQEQEDLRRMTREAMQARAELEQLHEELRLANEGLEKRMQELHRANKDLRVLDEMKTNLLANVSHELQTPLVSIKGFTEMILKGRLGDVTAEQERGLQVALRNINRLIGLIDNLLAFARTEGPTMALRLEVFALGPLVGEAVELVREKADSKNVSIRVVLPAGDLHVRADRDKILQVMLNLLTNAIKYNRDKGEVIVEADSGRKDVARVEVKDTGIGIPRDELDRIFDRYYQAGNVAGPREGTGIGLSITKNILRQHGCMIRADSEEGKGSVFSFTLPLDRKGKAERTPRFTGAAPEVSPEAGASSAGPAAPAAPVGERVREES